MTPLDGLSSPDITTLGLECWPAYSLVDIKDVGAMVIAGAATGTYTADADFTFDPAGNDLQVRASSAIKSASPIVVTINGTTVGGGVIVGTATIQDPADNDGRVAEGQAFTVVVAGGSKFISITSVTFTNGEVGDGFQIGVLPEDFVDFGFAESINFDRGDTVLKVWKRYDVDHNKRKRGENTLQMSELWCNNLTGLRRIENRDVTLRVEKHVDGAAGATETLYFQKCRLSAPLNMPISAEEHAKVNGTGSFGKAWIFS